MQFEALIIFIIELQSYIYIIYHSIGTSYIITFDRFYRLKSKSQK